VNPICHSSLLFANLFFLLTHIGFPPLPIPIPKAFGISLYTPMVLPAQVGGRVGSCQDLFYKAPVFRGFSILKFLALFQVIVE